MKAIIKKGSCTTLRGYDDNGEPKYGRKVGYHTFKEAEEWCVRTNLELWNHKKIKMRNNLLNVYKCNECGKYHTGRTNRKISLNYISKNKTRYIPQFKVLGKIDLNKFKNL
jgi:hypothetical protein